MEWVIQRGLWLASGCHGMLAPTAWYSTYPDNPNKAMKCHSVPPSFLGQTAINQNLFFSIGVQQHIKRAEFIFIFFSYF